jgi:hypothetical protein
MELSMMNKEFARRKEKYPSVLVPRTPPLKAGGVLAN